MTTRLLLAALVLAACGPREAPKPAEPPPAARPQLAEVVDSIRDPEIEGELRKLQAATTRVDSLADTHPTRDSLVATYVAALQRADTATLRRMLVTADEFAWLYYPTTPQGFPPYNLEAGLMWDLLQKGNRGGLARALRERGGRDLGIRGYECDSIPSREGANRVWGPCVVLRKPLAGEQGDVIRERLFSQILERDGRYKFLNYSNKLD